MSSKINLYTPTNTPTGFFLVKQIALYLSKIQDSYDEYWDSVKDFQKFLDKKGLRKESRGIGNSYKNLVLKFHKLLGKIVGKLQ